MSAGPAVAAVAEKSAAGTGAARDACRVPRAACLPRLALGRPGPGRVPPAYYDLIYICLSAILEI
jgi:hypothetical protein